MALTTANLLNSKCFLLNFIKKKQYMLVQQKLERGLSIKKIILFNEALLLKE